jgi:type II secretory pathway pseudopilin PulG
MKRQDSKKGFTMVELSLALIFISIILLTIAWLTMHITSIYEKGLSMKAVNSTAKELIDDFSRAIAGSPARTVQSQCLTKYTYSSSPTSPYGSCVSDNARKFVYQQRYGKVTIKSNSKQVVVPVNGVFCTGRYSYIWNTAYALNTEDYISAINYKATFNYAPSSDFRLLKVQDYERAICSSHVRSDIYAYDADMNYSLSSEPGVVIDLLDSSENNLALYDMAVFKPTVHKVTSAGFYSGSFILATLRGGVDITATGDFCSEPPDGLDTDFTYCSINKFNFSMRAAGEKMATER